MQQFTEDIYRFNEMYSLPSPSAPSTKHLPVAQRMTEFKAIILEEIKEVDDIIENAGKNELEDLTNLSDWLGDIIVYAASEMRRFGLPTEAVLKVIMQSNFSKLGADGKPIMSEQNKVLKGPNYWKPEPKIKEMLKEQMQ